MACACDPLRVKVRISVRMTLEDKVNCLKLVPEHGVCSLLDIVLQ